MSVLSIQELVGLDNCPVLIIDKIDNYLFQDYFAVWYQKMRAVHLYLPMKILQLQEFDLSHQINRTSNTVVISSSKKQRYLLLADYLAVNKPYFNIMLFTAQDPTNLPSIIWDRIPAENIRLGHPMDLLGQLIHLQNQRAKDQHRTNSWQSLIIFDLPISPIIQSHPCFRMILINGRHVGINSLFLGDTDDLPLSPSIRVNLDYIILGECPFHLPSFPSLYQKYGGIFPSIIDFKSIMSICHQNHSFLVINNTTSKTDLLDIVFFYHCQSVVK